MKKYVFFLLIVIINLFASISYSEIVNLIDGSKINGYITHYYRGELEVSFDTSFTLVPKNRIKSILFDVPPPNPEFSTPEKTFAIWENAMKKGDYDRLIDCYAMIYQNLIYQQFVSMPDADKEKMKNDFSIAEFAIVDTVKSNNKVILKIIRKGTAGSDKVEMTFINENSEWKLVPNL